ncbi:MAG: zinc ribbon domain-containing protein [Acidobacteria bacterium]|nr:MAG: zinc ribbon domain-containing protein [Acidobacteriota bacterium]
MPLYEYECQRCHRRVEKIQSFSAEPLKTCQFCGGPLEKLISAPAIQFKGTGWYVTDYGHSNTSTAASHEPHTNGDTAKPTDTAKSADAPKPASTAATKSSD